MRQEHAHACMRVRPPATHDERLLIGPLERVALALGLERDGDAGARLADACDVLAALAHDRAHEDAVDQQDHVRVLGCRGTRRTGAVSAGQRGIRLKQAANDAVQRVLGAAGLSTRPAGMQGST
jgi:hypothetical protein